MYTIEWSENTAATAPRLQTTTAATVQEVDELIDRLHGEFLGRDPVLVTVTLDHTGDSLAIGLGAARSILNYVSGSRDPPYFTSVGELRSNELVSFVFGGEWSELPIRHTIPVDTARKVLSHFCETGKLSDDIGWEAD